MKNSNTMKTSERTYFVSGMHCASCELIIEEKILESESVVSVNANAGKGEVVIVFKGKVLEISDLNLLFKENNYVFSEKPGLKSQNKNNDFGFIALTAGLLILIFLLLNQSGLSSIINVNSKSSLPMFFLFGLLAGVSSCAALIGGIVLSLSKQWAEIYKGKDSTANKMQPHLLFNAGRIFSFTILGAIWGGLGKKIGISLSFTSLLVVTVSLIMFIIGLQMLGVKYFQKFQIATPKFITRYVADKSNFRGMLMPVVMGGLTFFLPCGFTITTQGLALISGSPVNGALIMLAFVLGTTPVLLGIGLSSTKLIDNPVLSERFTKIAGMIVIFFALFNINSQLNVLGVKNINDLFSPEKISVSADNNLPPIINGKQIIKMNASVSGYAPNYFKVRTGTVVRWEITDIGTSGCTNAVISRGLFEDQISLIPGQVSVKEFTPEKPGIYKFSCWMGMVTGTIEVVDNSGNSGSEGINTNSYISSGADGCSCGSN